jgi:hypothetical protein
VDETEQLTRLIAVVCNRKDAIRQVRPVNARIYDMQRSDVELLRDIVDDFRRGRGGECEDGRRAERAHGRECFQVRRSKIVPPLRDAMRFVDDQQIDVGAGPQRAKLVRCQLLRRGEHELDGAPPNLRFRAAKHVCGDGALDLYRRDAER